MDLLNMPNRAIIHEFYKKDKWRKCLYFKPEFGDLSGGLNKIKKIEKALGQTSIPLNQFRNVTT